VTVFGLSWLFVPSFNIIQTNIRLLDHFSPTTDIVI